MAENNQVDKHSSNFYNKNSNKISLPFRPGVGMMIINQENKIFLGKRVDSKNSFWQMPQGGIDLGETPSVAAMREMLEEVGSKEGYIIAESKKWYSYRLPEDLIPKLWDGQYCGQKQKWFLIKFTGSDSDIKLDSTEPEFIDWRWVDFESMLYHVIPFKYKLYKKVLIEFGPIVEDMIRQT